MCIVVWDEQNALRNIAFQGAGEFARVLCGDERGPEVRAKLAVLGKAVAVTTGYQPSVDDVPGCVMEKRRLGDFSFKPVLRGREDGATSICEDALSFQTCFGGEIVVVFFRQ